MSKLSEKLNAVCLCCVLTVGAVVLIASLKLATVGAVVDGWQTRHHPKFQESVNVTRDGEVVVWHMQWAPTGRETFVDLEGNDLSGTSTNDLTGGGSLLPEAAKWSLSPREMGVAGRMTTVFEGVRGTEEWFFIGDGQVGGRAYFEGYDTQTRRRVGYIGMQGFQPTKPNHEEQFRPPVAAFGDRSLGYLITGSGADRRGDRAFLLSDQRVWQVNFESREVSLLIEDVVSMTAFTTQEDPSETEPQFISQIAFRKADSVETFDVRRGFLDTFSIPTELRDQHFTFHQPKSVAILVSHRSDQDDQFDQDGFVRRYPVTVAQVSSDGTIEQIDTVTISHSQTGPGAALIAGVVPSAAWVFGAVAPIYAAEGIRRDANLTWPQAMFAAIREMASAIVLAWVVGAVLAWLTLRHHRRTRESGAWMWTVFVFITGLPGYVGYRLHRRWPRLEPAAEIEWTGTEIFA